MIFTYQRGILKRQKKEKKDKNRKMVYSFL